MNLDELRIACRKNSINTRDKNGFCEVDLGNYFGSGGEEDLKETLIKFLVPTNVVLLRWSVCAQTSEKFLLLGR